MTAIRRGSLDGSVVPQVISRPCVPSERRRPEDVPSGHTDRWAWANRPENRKVARRVPKTDRSSSPLCPARAKHQAVSPTASADPGGKCAVKAGQQKPEGLKASRCREGNPLPMCEKVSKPTRPHEKTPIISTLSRSRSLAQRSSVLSRSRLRQQKFFVSTYLR